MSIIKSNQELEYPPFTEFGPVRRWMCPLPLLFPCEMYYFDIGYGAYFHRACMERLIRHFIRDRNEMERMAEERTDEEGAA